MNASYAVSSLEQLLLSLAALATRPRHDEGWLRLFLRAAIQLLSSVDRDAREVPSPAGASRARRGLSSPPAELLRGLAQEPAEESEACKIQKPQAPQAAPDAAPDAVAVPLPRWHGSGRTTAEPGRSAAEPDASCSGARRCAAAPLPRYGPIRSRNLRRHRYTGPDCLRATRDGCALAARRSTLHVSFEDVCLRLRAL